jgi:hypothetical protein
MARIVAGLGAPHSPNLPSVVERNPGFIENKLYGELRAHLERARADVLVIFSNDHFNTFFLENFPLFAIGAAPGTWGPNDQTPMPRHEMPVHEGLAAHIHKTGIEDGFDLALSQEFSVDHAFTVPYHFLGAGSPLAIVPIFVHCFSSTLPLAARALALGQSVGRAIRTLPGDLRVAVLASGSFSLEIGGPKIPPADRSGVPDRAWVDKIVAHLRTGSIRTLIDEATPLQLLRAGNAGGELLNWIAMLGAIGEGPADELHPQSHGHAFGVWRRD